MTASLNLAVSQLAPGAPLQVTLTEAAGSAADDLAISGLFLGVTTTSSPPATFADAAHTDGGDQITASYFQSAQTSVVQTHAGGVQGPYSARYTVTAFQRVDSNYVVGRFLWGLAFASNTPGGTDVPVVVAGPYTIR